MLVGPLTMKLKNEIFSGHKVLFTMISVFRDFILSTKKNNLNVLRILHSKE